MSTKQPHYPPHSPLAARCRGVSVWLWILVSLEAWLLYYLLTRRRQPRAEGEIVTPWHETPQPAPPAAKPRRAAQPAPAPDDLTRIEGIGPKIAAWLAESGIHTHAALARTPVGRLKEILAARSFRLADPSTWPEQARLAAAGDWEGLKALQARLKAGRRTA